MKGKVTKTGYKKNSPDVNNDYNIIPSGRITMRDVEFPVYGVDEYGNAQMMYPGGEYQFPGNQVFELPMAQLGGMRRGKVDRILNENRDLNFVQRMYQSGTPSIMIPGQDGPSTHFMESADGFVYPTVVQMPDGNLQYLGEGAYDHAMRTGEYIQFPNDRQARRFAKSYKKGTGVLKEYQTAGETSTEENPDRIAPVEITSKRAPWYKRMPRQIADRMGFNPYGYDTNPNDFSSQLARRMAQSADSPGGAFLAAVSAPFAAPQLGIMHGLTGEVQTPSEYFDIKNPVGAYITDAMLDPLALVGVGKLGVGKIKIPKTVESIAPKKLLDYTPLTVNQHRAQMRAIAETRTQPFIDNSYVLDRYTPRTMSQSFGDLEDFRVPLNAQPFRVQRDPIPLLPKSHGYNPTIGGNLREYGKGGLTQWFAEKWVDVKTGKECGRSGKDKNGRPYPACRPSKRVNETTPKTTSEMSSSEKAKFKREKTSGKRINYNHKRAQEGGQPVSLSWNDPEYRDYYNRLDKDVVIADPSGKTAGWEFLDEIEIYPDKRNLEPYWDILTEEEKRYWNDEGPIGRHVRMKAREGHGLTADDATDFVKALTLGPLDDALEVASIPSALAAEGFAQLKGDQYDYSNALPSFGTFNNTQRAVSETAADEVKWISDKTGIPEWAVGFGVDFATDPAQWIPATAAVKAPVQTIKTGARIAKTAARRGMRTGLNRIGNAVDNIPSRINPKYYNPTSVSTGNPDVYYRKVGKDAYEDFVNSGVLRTQAEVTDNPIMGLIETKRELGQVRDAIKDYGQFTYRHPTSFRAPYFSRGRTADMTSGADDYLFQTRPGVVGDDAFSSGQMDILHGSGNARVPVGGYGIMDPMQRSAENFDVFKKSWWHGYKPVNNLQKGGQKPEPTDWVDYLNPMNWFVTNRDQDGNFKQAFRAARNAGDDEFMWYGTRYTTDYAPQSDIKTVPVKKKEVAPAEIDLDFDTLKRGVSFVESRNGKYMWNPESSATGLYGQRFSEIQDTDVYSGTRENFRDDLDAQNRIFELRFNGELPGSTTGLKKDALDLYKEYYPIVKKNNISPVEIAALSNFLGRQGTRYYLGYVLRDGRSLEDVFPNLYGPEAGQSNKTPDQYLELFREAAYAEEQKVGGEIEKHPDYSDHSSYVNAWKAARRQLGAGKKFKYGGRVMSTSTPNGH